MWRELGVRKVIVPQRKAASTWCAFGAAAADVLHIFEHTEIIPAPVPAKRVNANLDVLQKQAVQLMKSEGIAESRQRFEFSVDARHKGQINEVELLLRWTRLPASYEPVLRKIFVKRYEQLYGRGSALPGAQLELVVFRLRARALTPRPKLIRSKKSSKSIPKDALCKPRSIWWSSLKKTPVYDGEKLAVGNTLKGRAIGNRRHHGGGASRAHAAGGRARQLRNHIQMIERLVQTTGIRLFVAEAGSGRPLVFFHGLGWDHALWRPMMESFGGRYRVVAGDARGHGRSDKPDVPYTIDLYAADWAEALKALGIEKACLVGFSQGGMAVQALAVKHPELVSALVLASCVCAANPAGREKMEARIRAAETQGPVAAAKVAAQSIFSKGFRDANPARIEEFVHWRAAMDQAPLVHATRAGYGFDVAEQITQIRVPTLVMYGEEDTLTPPPAVRRVAEQIPGAQLVAVPGAGHMIPVEKPAEFRAALEAFLGTHYPPAR